MTDFEILSNSIKRIENSMSVVWRSIEALEKAAALHGPFVIPQTPAAGPWEEVHGPYTAPDTGAPMPVNPTIVCGGGRDE